MQSTHRTDIQRCLGLDEDIVFFNSPDGRYIDLKCSHLAPRKKSEDSDEAFNFRISSNETMEFTIQIHWDNGEPEQVLKIPGEDNVIRFIRSFYSQTYITVRANHNKATKLIKINHLTLFNTVESTCQLFKTSLLLAILSIEVQALTDEADLLMDDLLELSKLDCVLLMNDLRVGMDTVFLHIAQGHQNWKAGVTFIAEGQDIVSSILPQIEKIASYVQQNNTTSFWAFEQLKFKFREVVQSIYIERFCS